MKKLFALAIALMIVFSCTVTAFASETTLTTTVPGANYVLNIPADVEVAYNATKTSIDNLSVSDASGFAVGRDLKVSMTYAPFKNIANDCEIPYKLMASTTYENYNGTATSSLDIASGSYVTFKGVSSGGVATRGIISSGSYSHSVQSLSIAIDSESWGKALPGDYTSTITFEAEVVSAG